MAEATLPERLVIIGGGFIGLEFASMYAQFGSAVTLLDTNPTWLPREDEDMARTISNILTNKGVKLELGVCLLRVESSPDAEDVVVYENQQGETLRLPAAAILVATGRTPNVASLNLAAAGIEQDVRGFVQVNERLQTNVPHIWALGDV
nr:dihydrolipoyl dehydrogenase, mitochondrial-like [Tanacetum cinerariifolium]